MVELKNLMADYGMDFDSFLSVNNRVEDNYSSLEKISFEAFANYDYKKATRYNSRIIKFGEEVDNDNIIADSYRNMAIINHELGNNNKAIKLLNNSLNLYFSHAKKYREMGFDVSNIEEKIMRIHRMKDKISSNIEEKINLKKQALEVEMSNINDIRKNYNNQGVKHYSDYDNNNAIVNFKKAVYEAPYETEQSGKAYRNLAITYFDSKDYTSALKHLDKAIEFYTNENNKEELSRMYRMRKRYAYENAQAKIESLNTNAGVKKQFNTSRQDSSNNKHKKGFFSRMFDAVKSIF